MLSPQLLCHNETELDLDSPLKLKGFENDKDGEGFCQDLQYDLTFEEALETKNMEWMSDPHFRDLMHNTHVGVEPPTVDDFCTLAQKPVSGFFDVTSPDSKRMKFDESNFSSKVVSTFNTPDDEANRMILHYRPFEGIYGSGGDESRHDTLPHHTLTFDDVGSLSKVYGSKKTSSPTHRKLYKTPDSQSKSGVRKRPDSPQKNVRRSLYFSSGSPAPDSQRKNTMHNNIPRPPSFKGVDTKGVNANAMKAPMSGKPQTTSQPHSHNGNPAASNNGVPSNTYRNNVNPQPTSMRTKAAVHARPNSGAVTKKKGCTCKNSKCLKLYCECFAAGVYCGPECSCRCCFNNAQNEDIRAQKMEDARQRKQSSLAAGCNCKKSGCKKKYCVCFLAGMKCTSVCQCINCHNCDHDHGNVPSQNPMGQPGAVPAQSMTETMQTANTAIAI